MAQLQAQALALAVLPLDAGQQAGAAFLQQLGRWRGAVLKKCSSTLYRARPLYARRHRQL